MTPHQREIKIRAAIIGAYGTLNLCRSVGIDPVALLRLVERETMMSKEDIDRIVVTEFESAASWCAARGLTGKPGDALPANICPQTLDRINEYNDEFQETVRLCAYTRAQGIAGDGE